MKSRIMLFFLLLFSMTIFSQEKIKFGVKAGANLAGFHTDNGTSSDVTGLNLGVLAKKDLNKTFGIQVELNLNGKGGTYRVIPGNFNTEYNLTYINLPILLKTHITRKFNIEIGPDFGILVGQKASDINGNEVDAELDNSTDININGGLSYEFHNGIFIQTRYGYGLTDLFENKDYGNSYISLSLGYFFK